MLFGGGEERRGLVFVEVRALWPGVSRFQFSFYLYSIYRLTYAYLRQGEVEDRLRQDAQREDRPQQRARGQQVLLPRSVWLPQWRLCALWAYY